MKSKQSAIKQPPTEEKKSQIASKNLGLSLFDHLPRRILKNVDSIDYDRIVHPGTVKLASLFEDGSICDDDDRIVSLIVLFTKIISDYKTPPKKHLREDLDKYFTKQIKCLVDSRPLSKGMGNVIKYVKSCISTTPVEMNEADAKADILDKLKSFLDERIVFAGDSIAKHVLSTMRDNDIIVTFGYSSLIVKILQTAAARFKFQLVIIDSKPLNNGLTTLSALSPIIPCVYTPISAAANAMKGATRVILGASSLFANGTMLAPAGSAMIASLAQTYQIPVIVAAESYKFTEKVQLDSIVFNEVGSSAEVALPSHLPDDISLIPQRNCGYRGVAESITSLDSVSVANIVSVPLTIRSVEPSNKTPIEILNLRYDLTPIDNISVVATEVGLLPPSSIPVLIRELQTDVNAEI